MNYNILLKGKKSDFHNFHFKIKNIGPWQKKKKNDVKYFTEKEEKAVATLCMLTIA